MILGVFPPGHDFDGYLLIRQLSAGGQGGVLLAEQAEPQQPVAIKVVFKHNADSLRHFERERAILSSFDHPNTARVISHGEYDGKLPYTVLNFIQGTGLEQFANAQHLPVGHRCDLFVTACNIVSALHGQGIVHCDLKPSNFIVTDEGRVTLIDFGSAFRIGRDEDGGKGVENPGTEAYMSPEQVRGEPLDNRTDVYSMGVVLYELLSGYLPFAQAPDVRAAIQEAARQPPSEAVFRTGRVNRGGDIRWMDPAEIAAARSASPEQLAGVLKAGLDDAIITAIRPDRDGRFPTVDAFTDAVRGCPK